MARWGKPPYLLQKKASEHRILVIKEECVLAITAELEFYIDKEPHNVYFCLVNIYHQYENYLFQYFAFRIDGAGQ